MSNTGKAIIYAPDGESDRPNRSDAAVRDADEPFDDGVLAAAAFNADRTDADRLWIRYVTVRDDRRGEGLGPTLCAFVADRAAERGFETLSIAVNNPFAYEALYRAGFAFSGDETGLAELVLARPAAEPASDRSTETYQDGLDRYRERDLSAAEASFLDGKRGAAPPEPTPNLGSEQDPNPGPASE
jgi:GNAT superfamily N-acetyltransferase